MTHGRPMHGEATEDEAGPCGFWDVEEGAFGERDEDEGEGAEGEGDADDEPLAAEGMAAVSHKGVTEAEEGTGEQ